MIVLAGKHRKLIVTALLALVLTTLIQVSFGGRVVVFHWIMVPAVAIHFAVRKFNRREIMIVILVVILGLIGTEYVRGARSPKMLSG
jgi:nitrate/nitrite transporter NarK